jgi:hypothetical protein
MAEEPSQLTDFNERFEDPSEDPLFDFDEEDPDRANIFARKELLKVGHVPESARIVGRDKEIKAVAAELRPIVQGDPPNNVMIYGKTGTGKSLVARHVTERARRGGDLERRSRRDGLRRLCPAQHPDQGRKDRHAITQRNRCNRLRYPARWDRKRGVLRLSLGDSRHCV